MNGFAKLVPALTRSLLLSTLLMLLAACTIPEIQMPGDVDADAGDIRTLYVGPQRAPCTGVAPMECLQVRESPDAPYTNFFDEIAGFEFAPGYEYELRVRVDEVEDPPADASSLRYTLVEVVNRTPVATTPLEGTLWTLAEYTDADGAMQSPLPESEGFILLENGELGGTAGCNSFFGVYVLGTSDDTTSDDTGDTDPNRLSFGEVGTTLMACEEPFMRQEEAVLNALRATRSYAIEGNSLTLLDADGNALVLLVADGTPASDTSAPDTPAAGAIEEIRWELREYAVDGELQPAVEDADAFVLLSGGDVVGESGCNRFGGRNVYTLDAENFSFETLEASAAGCIAPEDMDQEAALYAGLQAARSYRVENDTLTLLDADGNPALVFVADTGDEAATEDESMSDDEAETASSGAPDVEGPSLEGPIWNLVEYRDRDGERVAAVADGELELLDGGLHGFTGCNTMNGAYTLQGGGLSFGAIATTRRGCAPDIAAQEFAVLQALSNVSDYTIEDDTLTLVDADGTPQLVFVAQ